MQADTPSTDPAAADPYATDASLIREPPATLRAALPYVGPGFVLSASIVGSGELIATTVLGAEAGFVALWIILLSCLVKVALQLEFGRHTIQHGQTCVEAMHHLPGPKVLRTHWLVWIWLALWPVKILQVGGIIGALSMLLTLVFPAVSATQWCWIAAVVVAMLVSLGRYQLIERGSMLLLCLFTLLTFVSVFALQWTEFAISTADIAQGLTFRFPPGNFTSVFVVVFGAFGLTGVGGDEIMQYTYWLLEKGYAAYTGPPEDTDAWRLRARGWIRVMQLDALLSMVAYTVMTVAFFLLGAAVLHASGTVPESSELIETLATMYTRTLGEWARWVFLAGAFVVLFSTLFSALAAWTRIFTDAISRLLRFDFRDQAARSQSIFLLAWIFPVLWASVYVLYGSVVKMVVLGGVATSAILLMVVYAAVYFRMFRTRPGLQPSWSYDLALGVSAASIAAFAIRGLYLLFTQTT